MLRLVYAMLSLCERRVVFSSLSTSGRMCERDDCEARCEPTAPLELRTEYPEKRGPKGSHYEAARQGEPWVL